MRQAASLGHGAGWPQSLFSNRGENSPREEPPAGGSTRLGEKRETRGELGEVLASLVAAHAPTASPRLRRRRRPPRGPAPEVRLRQFRCSGLPDSQASRARRPCEQCRGVGELAPSLGGAWGSKRRGAGGAGPSTAFRWFVPAGDSRRDYAPSSTRSA